MARCVAKCVGGSVPFCRRRSTATGASANEGVLTMPVKSKAQRRKFAQLLVEGKIDEEVYERWNREAGKKKLPEHVASKKKKRKSKKAPKRKA
jgi:hypothetical protein